MSDLESGMEDDPEDKELAQSRSQLDIFSEAGDKIQKDFMSSGAAGESISPEAQKRLDTALIQAYIMLRIGFWRQSEAKIIRQLTM